MTWRKLKALYPEVWKCVETSVRQEFKKSLGGPKGYKHPTTADIKQIAHNVAFMAALACDFFVKQRRTRA